MAKTSYQQMTTAKIFGEEKRKKIASLRASILTSMLAMGAVSETSARPKADIAKRARCLPIDCAHHLYYLNPLASQGIVKQCQQEGVKGLAYYLSAKGKSLASLSREDLIEKIKGIPSVCKRAK